MLSSDTPRFRHAHLFLPPAPEFAALSSTEEGVKWCFCCDSPCQSSSRAQGGILVQSHLGGAGGGWGGDGFAGSTDNWQVMGWPGLGKTSQNIQSFLSSATLAEAPGPVIHWAPLDQPGNNDKYLWRWDAGVQKEDDTDLSTSPAG